jgi:4-alpha-glucanotransferase
VTLADPGRWGISPGYWDVSGRWRDAPAETVDAILAQMGATGDGPPPGDATPGDVLTVRLDRLQGTEVPRGRLVLEDGGEAVVDGSLPPDLPAGYHTFERDGGRPTLLVASPGRCPLPPSRQWGFAAQLYGVRSESSWGIGDFVDLASLAQWSAGLGAGLLVVNPLHATAPAPQQVASPYSPGSRCFLNPIYLAVERVPGAGGIPGVERLAASGRELNADPLVDRDRVWSVKSEALEAIFSSWCERGSGDPRFAAYREERGSALDGFAAYSALTELHGPRWQEWPAEIRHPGAPGVREFAAGREGARRVMFHSWLQWLADGQLADAGRFGAGSTGIVQDLAVGIDRDGADGWMWQDVFALGMDVGAPPDEFNTRGQNWALPPLDPWRLRSCGYRPWIESLRGVLRHAGGVRVDHVMGLFRLFWIPAGLEPSQGAYVRYPGGEMLDILALEADRAGAVVVGEDLGTVEDEVRAELYERQVLSYRVWWFEPERTTAWPERALAAVTTHDLPTIAGVLDRSDVAAQQECGMNPNEEASERLRDRLLDWTASDDDADAGDVIRRAYEDLARAPCLLLAVGLEDVLAVSERPNMPGTTDQWPNWKQSLPVPLEVIEQLELPRSVARSLDAAVHATGRPRAGGP